MESRRESKVPLRWFGQLCFCGPGFRAQLSAQLLSGLGQGEKSPFPPLLNDHNNTHTLPAPQACFESQKRTEMFCECEARADVGGGVPDGLGAAEPGGQVGRG